MRTQQAPFLVSGTGQTAGVEQVSGFSLERTIGFTITSLLFYVPLSSDITVQSSRGQLTQSLLRPEIDCSFISPANCENIQILCPAITHSRHCDFFELFLQKKLLLTLFSRSRPFDDISFEIYDRTVNFSHNATDVCGG